MQSLDLISWFEQAFSIAAFGGFSPRFQSEVVWRPIESGAGAGGLIRDYRSQFIQERGIESQYVDTENDCSCFNDLILPLIEAYEAEKVVAQSVLFPPCQMEEALEASL